MTMKRMRAWLFTCNYCDSEEIIYAPKGEIPDPPELWVKDFDELFSDTHYCPLDGCQAALKEVREARRCR